MSPRAPRLSPVEPRARRVLIVANPTSGGYDPRRLERIMTYLRNAECTVDLHLTSHAGEIESLAADPLLALDVLAIAGGDGSVNEALTGFQRNDAPPDLAVIPAGTANVLAHELGLPRRPLAIARSILAHRTRPLHFGLANGHPFVLMASAGFDAEVVHGVPLSLKRKLGKLAYVLTALRIGFTRRSSEMQVDVDGQTLSGKLVVATNGRFYGGPFVLCPDASVTTEGLHVLVLQKDDPVSALRFGLALMLGRVHKARGVTVMAFRKARVLAGFPVAVQIDGDPFGTTPLDLEPAATGYSVVVP
ncbi:diacylglycerol/lipid kinase family protein [Roseibium aestuarii]|uniref:Diacylglycerol/lipid kinase family protein n=1 Tax=Roseibium aestuarii TaxID=2600299 RepID=A0ABW4JWY9_9HYPH